MIKLHCLMGASVAVGSLPGAIGSAFEAYVRRTTPLVIRAYKTKDVHFFESLFDRSFTSKDGRGVIMGRKESLFTLRFQFNTVEVLDFKAKTRTIHTDPDGGSVTSTYTLVGLTQARRGQPGQKVKIVRDVRDVYRKRGSSWQIVYQEDTRPPSIELIPAAKATRTLTPASKQH